VIFPREQTLKNSRPTSAPFFAGWLSRPVMARRENNFWRSVESQCELGLHRTRLLDRDDQDRSVSVWNYSSPQRAKLRPTASIPNAPNPQRQLRQQLRRLGQRAGCSTIRMFIAARLNRPVVNYPARRSEQLTVCPRTASKSYEVYTARIPYRTWQSVRTVPQRIHDAFGSAWRYICKRDRLF
jgi:hypothetical protein